MTRRACFGAFALIATALLAGCARKANLRVPDGVRDDFPRSYPYDAEEEERPR